MAVTSVEKKRYTVILLVLLGGLGLLFLSVGSYRRHFTLQDQPTSVDLVNGRPYSNFAGAPPAYTAAVVYLVAVMSERRSVDLLFHSLSYMQKNIPWRYQWPVLLLHGGYYDAPEPQADFLMNLRTAAASYNVTADDIEALVRRIEFVTTHHEMPAEIPTDVEEYKPVFADVWPGYHLMCAFYSYKIFDHPRIRDLTYFLRLDDDSTIREPVCYDPFEYMHVHNKSYGFRETTPDPPFVTEGMWPFVSNYAQRYPEVESRLTDNNWEWAPKRLWGNYGKDQYFPSYDTNFDLVKVAAFRTPKVTAFFNELASDPTRFYWSRWGDAPVRIATVYMFLDVKTEAELLCGLPYQHKERTTYPECECVPLLD